MSMANIKFRWTRKHSMLLKSLFDTDSAGLPARDPCAKNVSILFHFQSWATIYCPVARFEETLYQQYGAYPSSEEWALYMYVSLSAVTIGSGPRQQQRQGSSLWSLHELSTSAFQRLSLANMRLAKTWQSPNVDSCRMSMGPPVSTV